MDQDYRRGKERYIIVAMKQRRAKCTTAPRHCHHTSMRRVGLSMGLDTVIVNIAVVGTCFGLNNSPVD